MKLIQKYPICSVAIGVIQILDAAVLYHYGGAVVPPALGLACIEFAWAIVSLLVIVFAIHGPIYRLATVFLGYNVLGWGVGVLIASPTEAVKVPLPLVVIGGVFGAAFAASSLYVASFPPSLQAARESAGSSV